jgi:sensor histidine kinase regulating citrate/malate metabolism
MNLFMGTSLKTGAMILFLNRHAVKRFHTASAESGRDPRGFGLWVCQELASHLGGRFELDATDIDQTRLVFQVPNREAPEKST